VGDAPSHDVVLVGAGFPERITFLNSVDWDGIDLGLYGIWQGFGLKDQVAACIRSGPVDNEMASALYRNATIGLNLYRRTSAKVESLNPRAYELAACGTAYLSEYRAESVERFGGLVPTFTTPKEAEALIRLALDANEELEAIREALPAMVADASWVHRAAQVLEDIDASTRRNVPLSMTTASDARLFDHEAGPSRAMPGQHWYQAEGHA
jgi:glycosyltransferase involved in cell wall biosynthesis